MLKSLLAFVYPAPSAKTGIATPRWLGLAALIIVLDQISKLAISSNFFYGESKSIIAGFFNLVLAHNTGAAFSFLDDAGGWQRWLFTAIAIVASVWIVRLLRQHAQQTMFCLALALVLGGALGNLIDRVAYGYVIDFIDIFYGSWHFPAFNVADSAISVGAGLLILDSFRKK